MALALCRDAAAGITADLGEAIGVGACLCAAGEASAGIAKLSLGAMRGTGGLCHRGS